MTFAEQLKSLIKKTGLSQRKLAEEIGIPLRTLESWIEGKRTPDKLKQWAVTDRISKIINENVYWARPSSIYMQPVRIGEATSAAEAVEILKSGNALEIVEVLKIGEKSKTTHNPNKVYTIDKNGLQTGMVVVVK